MYEFTRDGRCLSNGKALKPYPNTKGYLTVSLYIDGKRYSKVIHQEVARLYVPNPLNLPQVNHIDGDKTNCNDWNLEWCTCTYNNKHARDTGLNLLNGEDNGNSKLSNQQILEIRAKYPTLSSHKLAKEYDVSKTLILNIIHRRTWKHL